MQITLKSFGEITVEPRHGNYNVDLVVSGVSADDFVEGLEEKDLKELLSAIDEDILREYLKSKED